MMNTVMHMTKTELKSLMTNLEKDAFAIEKRGRQLIVSLYNADDVPKLLGLPLSFKRLRRVDGFPGKFLVTARRADRNSACSAPQNPADAGVQPVAHTTATPEIDQRHEHNTTQIAESAQHSTTDLHAQVADPSEAQEHARTADEEMAEPPASALADSNIGFQAVASRLGFEKRIDFSHPTCLNLNELAAAAGQSAMPKRLRFSN